MQFFVPESKCGTRAEEVMQNHCNNKCGKYIKVTICFLNVSKKTTKIVPPEK